MMMMMMTLTEMKWNDTAWNSERHKRHHMNNGNNNNDINGLWKAIITLGVLGPPTQPTAHSFSFMQMYDSDGWRLYTSNI